MFYRRKIKLVAGSSIIVVLAATVIFYILKNGFKADAPLSVANPATVSYSENGQNVSVASNSLSFTRLDTKEAIENDITTAVAIANGCKIYAGAAKVNLVNDSTFGSLDAKFDDLNAGNYPVCDTSDLTGPQKDEVTWNYPKLPDGFIYAPSEGMILEENPAFDGTVVAVSHGHFDGSNAFSCTLAGCTKGENW